MDVKEAVGKAREYIDGLYSDKDLEDVRLEEIKFDYESKVWNITFGFVWEKGGHGAFAPIPPKAVFWGRTYQQVRIDDESAEVEALATRFPNGLGIR